MDTFRRLLIRWLTPISKLVGHIYIAPKSREIFYEDYEDLIENIQVGDGVLSFSKGELTNYLIEGEYKHCAIYVGIGTVVEAVGSGVRRVPFTKFCSSKDKIAIVRPSFCDTEAKALAALKAIELVGKPYDYEFEPNEEAFYCAELLAYCYLQATNNDSPFIPREVLGVQTVLPSDFIMATNKFDKIMERPQL